MTVSTRGTNALAPDTAPPPVRRLMTHAVLYGLTPLIPLPWLDDWVAGHLKQNLIASVLHDANVSCEAETVRYLALGPEEDWATGCGQFLLRLPGFLLVNILFYLIRKLLKKLSIVFNLRTCAHMLLQAFEWGHLLRYSLEQGLVQPEQLDDPEIHQHLYRSIQAACRNRKEVPVLKMILGVLRDSRTSLRTAKNYLTSTARRLRRHFGRQKRSDGKPAEQIRRDAPPEIVDLAGSLANTIWQHREYLAQREQALTERMRRKPDPPTEQTD